MIDVVMGVIAAMLMVWGVGYLVAGWLDRPRGDPHAALTAHINQTRQMLDLAREINAVRITSTDSDRAVLADLREKARVILARSAASPSEKGPS